MKRDTNGALLDIPVVGMAPDEDERDLRVGVVLGLLSGFDENGHARVVPSNSNSGALTARSIVPLHRGQVGSQVVLAFERNDVDKPIVLGVVQEPSVTADRANVFPPSPAEASQDRETVVISAKQEIVLRCGQASVTLTRAGKILIKGAYVLSRSSGVNRIKGGSVQIN